jgi:broad specificity phosphatase PhoE
VETTVFIIRHGITDWHVERRVLGHRDIGLNRTGVLQGHSVAAALADVNIGEIVSSPLLRAVQTAEILAEKRGGSITRDPRLSDFRVGAWEALSYDEVAAREDYRRFNADPLNEKLPSGEGLLQIRDRAVGAIDQALRDAPTGESIAAVTHAGIARVILAHYLGLEVARYHHLELQPGCISVLSFRDDRTPPRVLALGWRPTIKELV